MIDANHDLAERARRKRAAKSLPNAPRHPRSGACPDVLSNALERLESEFPNSSIPRCLAELHIRLAGLSPAINDIRRSRELRFRSGGENTAGNRSGLSCILVSKGSKQGSLSAELNNSTNNSPENEEMFRPS